MDHTAYLILKIFGPWEDPCHIISFLPLCWVSVPVCYQQRRDGQTGRRRRAVASVGFTVATETMSSLLNTCFWWHHTPGLSTHSERSSSILSDIKRLTTGVCVCVCGEGGGGVWDNNDKELLRQKHRYEMHRWCKSLQTCGQPSTARPQTGRVILVFVYCECGLLV